MTTFSVIVPIYNIEKYLEPCVDSIIKQTYRDLEIILVDDGSTDNCPEICDRFATADSRIRVIHKNNGGLVSARKSGAKIATGDYIACIDGDDWVEANYFEKFAKVIDHYSPDIVCCGMIYQLKDGGRQEHIIKEEFGLYTKDDIQKKIFPHLIGFSNNVFAKVFKKNNYTNVQFSVDVRINMAEDACVVIPCVYNAESIFIIKDCLYNYRYNPSSMTKNKSVYSLEEPRWIVEHFKNYIDINRGGFKHQIYRSTVHRLINRCISQFHGDLSYRDVCKKLDACLSDPLYQECINNSRISLRESWKEWLALQVLKNRWYGAMKLYSRIR